MRYHHKWTDGQSINLPAGKAVCVGRNYIDHAVELGNPVPEEPVLFIKPASAFNSFSQPVLAKKGKYHTHYETELALLIGSFIKDASPGEAISAISGLGIALDLTLRDLQTTLKKKGLPWEKAKAFDGSCVISPFHQVNQNIDWNNIPFYLRIDGKTCQKGNSADMLFSIDKLLGYITRFFSLYPGDIVLTGTPVGTGQLYEGQRLIAEIPGIIKVKTIVQ